MTSRSLLILMLATALASGLSAEGRTASKAETARGDAEKGKVIYQRHCAVCHGIEGKADDYRVLGEQPANLTARSTKQKSDTELLTIIHEGKPNMPVWKRVLPETEIMDVLAYVRTLGANQTVR